MKTEIEEKSKSMDESSTGDTKEFKLVGSVLCPYCKKNFTVHHDPSRSNFYIWKITNWVRHLKSHNDNVDNVRRAVNKGHTKVAPTSSSSSIDSGPIVCTENKCELQSIDFPKIEKKLILGNDEHPKEPEVYIYSQSSEVVANYPKKTLSSNKLVNYSDSENEFSDNDDRFARDYHGKLFT